MFVLTNMSPLEATDQTFASIPGEYRAYNLLDSSASSSSKDGRVCFVVGATTTVCPFSVESLW